MATGKVTMPLAYHPGVDCVNVIKGQIPSDFASKQISGTYTEAGITTLSGTISFGSSHGTPFGSTSLVMTVTSNTPLSGFTITSTCVSSSATDDVPQIITSTISSTQFRVCLVMGRAKSLFQKYQTTFKNNSTGKTWVYQYQPMSIVYNRQSRDGNVYNLYRAAYLYAYWADKVFT